MVTINEDDDLSLSAVAAIKDGDIGELRFIVDECPWLATAWLRDTDPWSGMSRTLLHVVAEWPGHVPNGAASVAALVEAGTPVDARFRGPHQETALHWSATSDDVEVLDALLDAGADIDVTGAVVGGGSPLANAVGYRRWNAAARLVERGARTTLADAATLGLTDRLDAAFASAEPPGPDEMAAAFWGACHGGRQDCAEYLLDRGARTDWMPAWDPITALDAARRAGAGELVTWLDGRVPMPETAVGE